MSKREVEIVVISDTHLGTFGAHAKELLNYMNSIKPNVLVLNGDIIDMWQFKKRNFRESHFEFLSCVIQMMEQGTKVYYLPGNHDDELRRYCGTSMGNLSIRDHLLLRIDGKVMWFFHGDVFDISIQHSKWLAKLGGEGYDLLIYLNRALNHVLEKLGRPKMSLSKKIKNNVKKAVSYIQDFENVAIELAIESGYDMVICGHIHQPVIRQEKTEKGETVYLNSGDWVESLTSLEYNEGAWSIYEYSESLDEKPVYTVGLEEYQIKAS